VSIPNRIFRISKAYLNQVRQRIDDELSERELDTGIAPGGAAESARSAGLERDNGMSDDPAVRAADEMMRRAEERIAAARRDMESRGELEPTRPSEPARTPSSFADALPAPPTTSSMKSASASESDPNAADYRVLGVPVGSDLATVQSSYEKLVRRLDPSRFTEDPAAQKDALRILERVNSAFESLRNRLDPTQNRFGKLELE